MCCPAIVQRYFWLLLAGLTWLLILQVPVKAQTIRSLQLEGRDRLLSRAPNQIRRPALNTGEGLLEAKSIGTLETVVNLDDRTIRFVRTIDGYPIRLPYVVSLDDYFAAYFPFSIRSAIDSELARQARVQEQGLGGRQLKFEVPIQFPNVLGLGGGIGLEVTGSQRIDLSGRSEWIEGQTVTATNRPSRFPRPNMKQVQRFRITGKVGDKIAVEIDQDSERLTDLENNIKISYEGDPDEIIQRIDAGNTSLSLPNTQFAGYSEQHSGLFGIKAQSRIGNLELTSIVSQEKGEGQGASFKAGAQASTEQIRDVDFRRRTYFFLGENYHAQYSRYDPETRLHLYNPADSLTQVRVFVDDRNNLNDIEMGAIPVLAVFNPANPDTTSPRAEFERGRFHELATDDYFLDSRLGYIALSQPLQTDYILAVYYRTKSGAEVGLIPADPQQQAILKLIKPQIPDPQQRTWKYEWKNVYFLGKAPIDPKGFDLKIFRRAEGAQLPSETQGDVPYLQILGLDRRGLDPGSPPDGIVDIDREIINFGRGELIFPDLRPFDHNPDNDPAIEYRYPPPGNKGLEDRNPDLYDTREGDIQLNMSRVHKFYLTVQFQDRQSTYSLGRPNIIPGSEVVKLNGRRMQPNRDYTLIYEIGQITFLNDELLDPNADVTVDFQYAPFFKPASSTLLGVRGQYHLGENSWIGTTVLYQQQKTLEQKVRVGEEPARSMLWDMDAALRWRPTLMTRLVDALPFVETEEPSILNVTAELAQSRPNPNTKGDGIIDDFEGSKETTTLGVIRQGWTESSAPWQKTQEERGRLLWYNPIEQIPVRQIFPNRETTPQESRMHVLTLDFEPSDRSADPNQSWGGIIRSFTGGYIDQSRSKFIEIWVNGNRGQLHLDLGRISEDLNGDGILNTEDKPLAGFDQGDGILQAEEDVGLDGLPDEQEPGYDALTNPDPNGDDWAFDRTQRPLDYSKINGTEGNGIADNRTRPDTEDINNDGFLDFQNDYFSYTIDLSPSSPDTQFVAGGDRNRANWASASSWRLYRIPLVSSTTDSIGRPDLTLIKFARLWIDHFDQPGQIRIAVLDIVGSRWQELGVVDSLGASAGASGGLFAVTQKNTFDNPNDYQPPQGVVVEIDPVTRLRQREQSLVLLYEDLQPGYSGQAFQSLFADQDYTEYREIRMFVHGSETDTTRLPEFFVRLGASERDFYEYRVRVYPGWDPRNEVRMNFDQMTALKTTVPDTSHQGLELRDGPYHIKGRPTLSRVRQLIIGVSNPNQDPIRGEVWIDELRATNVRDDKGLAGRLSVEAKFADLLDLNVDFRLEDSFFRRIGQKESGSDNSAVNVQAQLALDQFLPSGWGINLPVNVSTRRNLSRPRLKPGSDITLPTALRTEQRTESFDQSGRLAFQKRTRSNNLLAAWTVDRINIQASGARRRNRSVTRQDTTSNYHLNANYDLTPKPRTVKPFRWLSPILPASLENIEITYLPAQLTLDAQVEQTRQQGVSINQTSGRAVSRSERFTRDLNRRVRGKLTPTRSISVNYMLRVRSDIRQHFGLTDYGIESDRQQTLGFRYNPGFFKWLRPSYAFNASYQEDQRPEFRTVQQDSSHQRGERTIRQNTDQTVRSRLDLPRILGWLGGARTPSRREESDQDRKGMVAFLQAGWSRFAALFTPLDIQYQSRNNQSLFGALGRPGLAYQLGFSTKPEVTQNETVGIQRNSQSMNNSFSLRTGFKPLGSVNINTQARWNTATNITATSETRSSSRIWPDVNLSWTVPLDRLGFLKKHFTRLQISSTFSNKTDDRSSANLGRESQTLTTAWSPLVGLTANWSFGMRTTLKFDRNNTRQDNFRGGRAVTQSQDRNFSLVFDYRLKPGFKIPFFGGGKGLSNSMDITVEFMNRTSLQQLARGTASGESTGPLQTTREQVQFSIRPRMSYNFTRKVRGGLTAEWTNTEDKTRKEKRRIREVGFWTEFSF